MCLLYLQWERVGGVRVGVWEAEGVKVQEVTGGFTCVYALGC